MIFNRFLQFLFHLRRRESLSIGIIFLCLIVFSTQSFSQLANGHDKYLGNASDPPIPANYEIYWNQLTPGNAGKWGSVESVRDVYNWTPLDQAYNYAIARGFAFKHHILVQGSQQPGWITALDSTAQLEEIEEWFRLVGERYPDLTLADVVGEVISNQPPYKKGLGGDGLTGWDWVIKAFQLARQYLPAKTKLILLEANIINGGPNFNQFIQIVNLLKERTLIDGIGLVAHNLENVDTSIVQNSLNQLTATGVDIYIHSLDIGSADDAQQLALYQEKFPVLWEHQGVKGITLWGYIQNQMFQPNGYLLRTDGTERPALMWLREYLTLPGTYRSFQSGNWNSVNSWEFYDGTNWVHPAPTGPSQAQHAIIISNGHTIIVTVSDSASGIVVEPGGTLAINSGVTFLVKDGYRIDLAVSGTIANSGILIKEAAAEIDFTDGSKYLSMIDGGLLPSAIWGEGSIVQFDSIKTTSPLNANQNFYNVVWNCPQQTGLIILGWNKNRISGNITLQSTGTGQLAMCAPEAGDSAEVTIGGNVTQSGGQFTTTATENGGTAIIISHSGNITVTGGNFSISRGSQGGTGTTVWNQLAGNFSMSNAQSDNMTTTVGGAKFVFSKAGTQSLTLGSGNTINSLSIEVKSGTTLSMGNSVLSGAGNFILNSGATIECAQPGGLDGAIVNSGTKVFDMSASYTFNGSAAQVTGAQMPDTVYNLTINNSAGVTLSAGVVVNGKLEIKNGVLSLGGKVLAYGPNGLLKYSGSSAQITSDAEFPEVGGPRHLTVATGGGLTLHASRILTGNLDLLSKLRIGANSIAAASTSNANIVRYVVTGEGGALRLSSVGSVQVLFPVGVNYYAPLWISNSGTTDTLTVGVVDDATPATEGGRVNVKWNISENIPGDGNYILQFGWMPVLEDATLKADRLNNAKIFEMTDTTEAGSGMYTTQFASQPYYVARGGITTLGPFAVGRFGYVDDIAVEVVEVPQKFSLNQNYPNPFNPCTTIEFTLHKSETVTLKVFSILGQQVASLVSGKLTAGVYKYQWHANNLPSGIYYCRMQAGEFEQVRKMILLR